MRLSRVGVVAVVVLTALVAMALVGSGVAQIVGFIGAVLVVVALVGGVPGHGASPGGRWLTSTATGRTITHAEPDVLDEAPVDQAAWERERERRDRGGAADGAPRVVAPEGRYDPFKAGRRD